jgi:opine dehydrogenase
MSTYCVLGAGHGGMALAGHLGQMGFSVRIWSRNPLSLDAVAIAGGVVLTGVQEGFGPVQACSDLSSALEGADVILIVVHASAHQEIATLCAPYLKDGQTILLLPGRTAGAIEFTHTLHQMGCCARVLVGEAQTFPYASRRTGPNTASIYGIKRQVLVAALPAYRTHELLRVIRPAFPQFMPARGVWKTSLDNIGAVFHPAVALLNSARIESTGGAFRHYQEGITPSVAGLLEQMDTERLAVARAIGVGALTAREWLAEVYDVDRPTLYEAIQATPAYGQVGAPVDLNHRFIWEDVPTGLVPIEELGKACGIPTPIINTVIDLACGLCRFDFRKTGRTLARLGMLGWTSEQISRYALEGDVLNLV